MNPAWTPLLISPTPQTLGIMKGFSFAPPPPPPPSSLVSYSFRRSGSGGQIEITGQDTTDQVDCTHLVAEQKIKENLLLLLLSVLVFSNGTYGEDSLPDSLVMVRAPDTVVTSVQ